MLNCGNCGFQIPINKESRRQIFKGPTVLLNFIKITLFRKKTDCKKKLVCQFCAKKIDRINNQIEITALLLLLFFAIVTIYSLLNL